MLNRSASLAMSTSVLKALPGKLDIKRHLPSILYIVSMRITVRSVGGYGLLISPALFVHLSIKVTIQLHDNLKKQG